MIAGITYYKILFTLEILVAEFLFTFRLKKRKLFALKLSLGAVVLLVIAAFFPTLPKENPWYTSFTFFTLFALTVPLLAFSYKESLINVLFCCIAAYTLQHFAYELANIILSLVAYGENPIMDIYSSKPVDFSSLDKRAVFYLLVYIFCYICSYWAFFGVYGKKIRKDSDMKVKSVSLLFLIGAGLLADVFINSFVVYAVRDWISVCVTGVSNMLCCALLLYALFGLLYSKELQNEVEVVNSLYYEEQRQYAMLKKNMDLINMKCHDMRHQIREIGKNQTISDDTIAEMEKAISLYDTVVKTGNETLDVILTEKNLRCHTEGITFSFIADGAALNFMKEGELYSLFGNALDNAIEACAKIPDFTKRLISFKIHATGSLVTISITNSFTGTIELGDDGLPKTHKSDTDYHGFGMKSMKYTVEKYGGDMYVDVKDGLFGLNILIPVGTEPED